MAGSTVTLVATADDLPSAQAGPWERARRERVAVVAAQGALDFTAVERVLYALDEARPQETGAAVLDLRQVTGIDSAAQAVLQSGLGRLVEGGVRTAVADPAGHLVQRHPPPEPDKPNAPTPKSNPQEDE
ncbi:STAS domain-containing protein, partial [Streptomyces sp. NPDC057557]|uniref:STAS domain-containing protein n=1 Tax=Streptomyces sp. NPDC057557 TaxID=3346167 RepID=UPI0036963B99